MMASSNLTQNFNEGEEYNWYPNSLAPCSLTKFFGFWMFINSSFGTLFNGMIIYVYIKNKELQSPTNAFIVSINICDVLACLLEMPLPMIANFSCKWIWGKAICYFEAFIAYFVGTSSMYILCLASIDRWIAISHPLKHGKITKNVQIGCILFCYLQGLLWAGFPLAGWSSYGLEGILTSCSIAWQDRSANVMTYNILMFVFVLAVPVITMVIVNFKLYMTIRHVARHGAWDLNDPKTKKKLEVEKRIAKTAALMIVGFLAAWGPYAAVAFISAFDDPNLVSPVFATLPSLCAKTQVLWNPLIYIVTNKNFRQKLPFMKNKVQNLDTESSQSQTQNGSTEKPKLQMVPNDEEVSGGGATVVSQVHN